MINARVNCLLILGLRLSLATSLSASAEPAPPRVEEILPGIWRLSFGTPEKLTPEHFRSAPSRRDGLAAMPKCPPPFQPEQIAFAVSARGCSLQLPLDGGERIYGFGLNSHVFEMTTGQGGRDHSGRHVLLRPTDGPENDLNDSHAPVPFYVSSRGYGVYVDTARYASFYTGNAAPAANGQAKDDKREIGTSTAELYAARTLERKTMLVDVPVASGVDVYVFGGPAMSQAVQRYNLFSGGGAVPPLWGLGVAYRGFGKNTADETLKIAAELRDQHIPCDVWGLEPGWQSHAYACTFVWNEQNFPQPADFVRKMTALGYHINAWQHCFTHPASPIHDALKPFAGDYLVWDGLVPDFATPEGRKIFQGQQEKALFSLGVDGVKLDECDHQPSSPFPWSFPEASHFPSGLDGEQMHSLLGVLYQQTELEPSRQRNLRTWGLVRNSQALAAPLPYTLYSDTYDDRCYVRVLAKQGFSGLLWVPEVRDAHSVEELYRRVQATLFAPQLLINGWYIRPPPWFQIDRAKNQAGEPMPEQAAATATIKRLFELRMSFVPYLYAAYNEYRLHGTPPIRALVLDWPDDPAVQGVDDEFMAGPSLLVAPIFTGEKGRKVYLPHGDWFDYWTGEKITGGQSIDVAKGLDQIPLYVKAGTLLPLAVPVERITPDTCFDLNVRVYGDGSNVTTLYEDDGVSYDFEQGRQNRLTLGWDGKTLSQRSTGEYRGPARYKITGTTPIPGAPSNR